MIFGNCNLKIINLYPRLDRNSLGNYYFLVGIDKKFAKKCYAKELNEQEYLNFQERGKSMIKKVLRYEDYMSLFTYKNPYRFFENKKGNLTCLISNLDVLGDACGLYYEGKNIEEELNKIDKYRKFIELYPHNIDSPIQCYAFLSLLTIWEEIMDAVVNSIE